MAAELIQHALDEVRTAMYEAQYPELSEHQNQLMRAENELMEMVADIEERRVMTNRSGLAHMVVDSWPLPHPVSDAVVAAVQNYEDRRRQLN